MRTYSVRRTNISYEIIAFHRISIAVSGLAHPLFSLPYLISHKTRSMNDLAFALSVHHNPFTKMLFHNKQTSDAGVGQSI